MVTRVRISGVIDAPREHVFELFMDPDRRNEWNPTARGILEQSGPLNEAGTRYVVDTRFGPFEVHVLRVKPPELVEMLEGVGRRGEAHVTIRFDPADGGRTRLTSQQTLSTRGRLGWLSGPLITPFAWLYGQIELRRLRRVAERDARSHTVD